MTTEEDLLFLEILDTVDKMGLPEEDKATELMERFARIYKSKIDSKEWNERDFSETLKEGVKYAIPEEYL